MSSIEGALVAHLVREALDGVLAPTLASALVFDALAATGGEELPTEAEPLKSFLTSALQPRLSEHLGARMAASLVDQLHTLVDSALGGTPQRKSLGRTANQDVDEGPVRVMVIASEPMLTNRLLAALGPDNITAYRAPTADLAAQILGGLLPPIVLVDALSPLPFSLEELVGLMRSSDALLLVWGSDCELGKRLLEILGGPHGSAVGLRPSDGSGPLMDYVLSRRAQSGPHG